MVMHQSYLTKGRNDSTAHNKSNKKTTKNKEILKQVFLEYRDESICKFLMFEKGKNFVPAFFVITYNNNSQNGNQNGFSYR